MPFQTARDFTRSRPSLPPGIVAILLCESPRHAAASARRLAAQGAACIIVLGDPGELGELGCPVIRIAETPRISDVRNPLNTLFDALDGRWVLWLWAGEFLFFPFCETRCLTEFVAFLQDERRRSLFTYALDLYGTDLPAGPAAPEDCELWFDRVGYHVFPKPGQQLRLFGGLGWRFEEIAPPQMQQIGRTALLLAERGVHLNREMLFGESEYDTVSCPWHHSPTGAMMTLRRAHRIMAHPGFPEVAGKLIWRGSTRFEWTSGQLMELGMIEPGQWF